MKAFDTEERALTLIEVLVTMAILMILSGMLFAVVGRTSRLSRQTACMSNLRQISAALLGFYQDKNGFPEDGPGVDLSEDLEPYLPAEALRCAADDSYEREWAKDPSYNSYEQYYVRRPDIDGSYKYIVGCPRHRDDDLANSVFGLRSVRTAEVQPVWVSGKDISKKRDPGARVLTSGMMQFKDPGTNVTVLENVDNFQVHLIYSARLSDGTLYSIVRMTGKGKAEVSVQPGSKFEVITPVAIAGVRGTKFSITVFNDENVEVTVTEGTVLVGHKLISSELELGAGETAIATKKGLRRGNEDNWYDPSE